MLPYLQSVLIYLTQRKLSKAPSRSAPLFGDGETLFQKPFLPEDIMMTRLYQDELERMLRFYG